MTSRTAEHRVSVPLLRASWERLTFVHWRVAPQQVQALLPPGLTVDVHEGTAWVGLTPFVMAHMRPLGLPGLPGRLPVLPGLGRGVTLVDLSSAPETNLRTYVRGPDGRDGLWFLSLDIGRAALAVALRAAVGAPYHHARMAVEQTGDRVTYTGSRVGGDQTYRLVVRPGEPIAPSERDVWLTGRWNAYTHHLGQLLRTPVEHEPWPLREATLDVVEENLVESVGLDPFPGPPLVHFSEGVRRVRLGRPTRSRST